MIKVDCEQGTDLWFEARNGIPTASNFSNLMTPGLKLSASADEYLHRLIGEWVSGEKEYIKPSYWMERGIDMEPEARSAYEFQTDTIVDQVGFIYKDKSKLIGCSPDGLEKKKGVEIKCPMAINHIAYISQGVCPKKYVGQVQGSMYVTGLKSWDFVSYHPDYPIFITTVEVDPDWQKAFKQVVDGFIERMMEKRSDPLLIEMRDGRIARGE